eukprot:COSAG01_NODE_6776_length_3502_cov_32.970320_3_plen_365_part_00
MSLADDTWLDWRAGVESTAWLSMQRGEQRRAAVSVRGACEAISQQHALAGRLGRHAKSRARMEALQLDRQRLAREKSDLARQRADRAHRQRAEHADAIERRHLQRLRRSDSVSDKIMLERSQSQGAMRTVAAAKGARLVLAQQARDRLREDWQSRFEQAHADKDRRTATRWRRIAAEKHQSQQLTRTLTAQKRANSKAAKLALERERERELQLVWKAAEQRDRKRAHQAAVLRKQRQHLAHSLWAESAHTKHLLKEFIYSGKASPSLMHSVRRTGDIGMESMVLDASQQLSVTLDVERGTLNNVRALPAPSNNSRTMVGDDAVDSDGSAAIAHSRSTPTLRSRRRPVTAPVEALSSGRLSLLKW